MFLKYNYAAGQNAELTDKDVEEALTRLLAQWNEGTELSGWLEPRIDTLSVYFGSKKWKVNDIPQTRYAAWMNLMVDELKGHHKPCFKLLADKITTEMRSFLQDKGMKSMFQMSM